MHLHQHLRARKRPAERRRKALTARDGLATSNNVTGVKRRGDEGQLLDMKGQGLGFFAPRL